MMLEKKMSKSTILLIILIFFNTLNAESSKLKILIVAYTFPKVCETFVVNQVTGLLSRGHDVYVYAMRPKPSTIQNEDFNTYNLAPRTYYQKLPPDLDSFDIIVCQFGMLGNELLKIKKKNPFKAKLATFFRGFDISRYFHDDPHMYDELFKKGDLFLTNCEFFKQRLLENGAPADKVRVHYSTIDCSKFAFSIHRFPEDGKIKIATVARLVEKKGIEDALYAISQVIKKYPNLEYTIIGEGPLKEKLESLTKKLGLTNYVTFAGWQQPLAVAQYLRNSHMFILPCVTAKSFDQDAIPNVLKEAMATGLPVVSTCMSGISEGVIDGVNGFLVKEHDIKSLADKILELIAHPELWEPFGKNGRMLVEEKFEKQKKSKELEEFLIDCVLQK